MNRIKQLGMCIIIAALLVIIVPSALGYISCSATQTKTAPVTISGGYFQTEDICSICRPSHCSLCYNNGLKRFKLNNPYSSDGMFQLTASNKYFIIDNLGGATTGCTDYRYIGLDWIKFCQDNGDTNYDNDYCYLIDYAGDLGLYFYQGTSQNIKGGYIKFNRVDLYHYGYTSTNIKLRWPTDGDGDGSPLPTDCNDRDASIRPGATELCNGKDDDCDGQIDEGYTWNDGTQDLELGDDCGGCSVVCMDLNTASCACQCQIDFDNDGYGLEGTITTHCSGGTAYDCNDNDADIYPGAPELCDGKSNDCSDLARPDGADDTPSLGDLQKGVCAGNIKICSGGSWMNDFESIAYYESLESSCNDETDNDCDGVDDCLDPDCSENPLCISNIQYFSIPKSAFVYRAGLDVSGVALNPGIDIGIDGTKEWEYSGQFSSTESMNDFSDTLNYYLDNVCTEPLTGVCVIPVEITAESGSMTLSDIQIQYLNYYWNTTDKPEGIFYGIKLFAEEAATCGNWKMEKSEECDDGNTIYGDGCSGKCTLEGVYSLECTHIDGVCPTQLGFIEVLRTSGLTDAHASLPGEGDFTNKICCKIEGASLTDQCTTGPFLQLSDTEDAHVQEPGAGGFINDACMSVSPASKAIISCSYEQDDCALDDSTETICVASLSDDTDAHIGDCDAYDTKVCCAVKIINVCGDGVCDEEEGCGICEDDCGTCPVCGDGITATGEECDDSNTVNNDGCSDICFDEYCGDGVLQSSEECDDSNNNDGDGCSSACIKQLICDNDGICDDGETCMGCTADCPPSAKNPCLGVFCAAIFTPQVDPATGCCFCGNCGDGQCAQDENPSTCPQDCPGCGDGIIDPGEQCDDNNIQSYDGCSDTCQTETCNQICAGIYNMPGSCRGTCQSDQSNEGNIGGCSNNCCCDQAVCGDNTKEGWEVCDGNAGLSCPCGGTPVCAADCSYISGCFKCIS